MQARSGGRVAGAAGRRDRRPVSPRQVQTRVSHASADSHRAVAGNHVEEVAEARSLQAGAAGAGDSSSCRTEAMTRYMGFFMAEVTRFGHDAGCGGARTTAGDVTGLGIETAAALIWRHRELHWLDRRALLQRGPRLAVRPMRARRNGHKSTEAQLQPLSTYRSDLRVRRMTWPAP